MLYRIGNATEAKAMQAKLPESVFTEIIRDTSILDDAYGAERNYLESGGYILIAETSEDILNVQNIVDYETHPCEWVKKTGDYISALYLLNDDYSILVFLPQSITPEAILKDLEEQPNE